VYVNRYAVSVKIFWKESISLSLEEKMYALSRAIDDFSFLRRQHSHLGRNDMPEIRNIKDKEFLKFRHLNIINDKK